MKAFLGLLQIGFGIGGFIALLNGKWLWMIVAWVAALLVGLAGNRMVRATDGISESGRAALGDISRAVDLLRSGQFSSASGVTRSAVSSFRMGGDKHLLPIALTLHAVALASVRDVPGSRRALEEASGLFNSLPPGFASEIAGMRHVHSLVLRQLELGVPDPAGMVADFVEFNDAK